MIFTGIRCVIFVKLPVALSGGRSANAEPLAGERLATLPRSTMPGKASTLISAASPTRNVAELRFTIVRQYPYVVFDQRNHLCSRIDHLSRTHLPLAHDSVCRSADSGVVQAAARCGQRSLMGREAGGQLRLTRLEHQKPSMFGFNRSFAAQKRCIAFLQRGLTGCQLRSRAFFLSDCLL